MRTPVIKSIRQRGVVLFFALIALVAMSLAAVALIRSVDTNTLIAGNLALKQSALVASDRGVETALEWLDDFAVAAGDDLSVFNNDSAADGYYATYLTPDLDDPEVLKNPATWEEGQAAYATGADISGGTESASGNNIRYIIQRMCRVYEPEPSELAADCLLGDSEVGTGSRGVKDATQAGAKIDAKPSPMYRITTRVAGAKNTYSYAQTFVY